ncbi:ABC transporter permease [Hypericibacter terrae]|uniref:ABC transporter permease n=1 Tax=Hypericibacter terrae TaxID=2602015 RepID=UPI001CD9B501|nr:ABC transporter permease [Hypericibacter terrae]
MATAAATDHIAPGLTLTPQGGDTLLLSLSGDWQLRTGLPTSAQVDQQLGSNPAAKRLKFDAGKLGHWDSGLLAFLVGVQDLCKTRGLSLDAGNLPEGADRLLKLAVAVPERQGAQRTGKRVDFLTLIGREAIAAGRSAGEMVEFLGMAVQTFGKLMIGRARYRRSDLVDIIYECGAAALPIVALISFLVGLILAFVGAIQLQQFGAQIYVADLVGIAMAREMGALMTAIIMSGRTGAAFAAQLGTMQVNEEIDALSTFGLSSMEFLVLPRMIALIVMMPLLCIFADLMGILGGALVGVGMLHLSLTSYVNETLNGVGLMDFAVGIFKSSVFGVLVAVSGCLRGIQCGRSASAVGLAATSAVVTGIVFIIVTDGIFAVITAALGI